MTTEQDFQRLLDQEPNDWQTRLVFADWLEECGDRRAFGVRTMVELTAWCLPIGPFVWWEENSIWYGISRSVRRILDNYNPLGDKLFSAVIGHNQLPNWESREFCYFKTRQYGDDVIANACIQLYGVQ